MSIMITRVRKAMREAGRDEGKKGGGHPATWVTCARGVCGNPWQAHIYLTLTHPWQVHIYIGGRRAGYAVRVGGGRARHSAKCKGCHLYGTSMLSCTVHQCHLYRTSMPPAWYVNAISIVPKYHQYRTSMPSVWYLNVTCMLPQCHLHATSNVHCTSEAATRTDDNFWIATNFGSAVSLTKPFK